MPKKCGSFEVADKQYAVLEVIAGQAIHSKSNFFAKIIPTLSNFYIYHKYMTYHIYYSIFENKLHLFIPFFASHTECS